MRYELTLIAAAGAFLAFSGVSPEAVAARADATPSATPAPVPYVSPDPSIDLPAPARALRDRVEEVVDRLDRYVGDTSHPEALRYAVRAYHRFKEAHPEEVRKPYLYFVDFGLDSTTPRGWVLDMEALRVVEGPFMVAHGRGSVAGRNDLPTRFLNVRNSNATSLGLYLAEETYGFRGKSGGRAYRSVGLRLRGVSGRFNDAARSRGIVVHGAPYVTNERAGRSEGCPAMPQELARELIPRLANGGLVFHFSPLDSRWLREDPWAGEITPTVVRRID